jgi:hypothetical protein
VVRLAVRRAEGDARVERVAAADSHDRPELYRCYLSALAEEEQAAVKLERAVNLESNGHGSEVRASCTSTNVDRLL